MSVEWAFDLKRGMLHGSKGAPAWRFWNYSFVFRCISCLSMNVQSRQLSPAAALLGDSPRISSRRRSCRAAIHVLRGPAVNFAAGATTSASFSRQGVSGTKAFCQAKRAAGQDPCIMKDGPSSSSSESDQVDQPQNSKLDHYGFKFPIFPVIIALFPTSRSLCRGNFGRRKFETT